MPHSYIVETANGKKYRRNRRHLMKCHQDNESSLDDHLSSENPEQEEERNRNDDEPDMGIEPPQQDTEGNEQEDFEQEDDPKSAETNSADTPEKQVTQDEMALQPQATRNARGRVIN